MKSSIRQRILVVAVFALLTACKAPASSCAAYGMKLCEGSGLETPTCQAIRTTTDLMPPEACAAGLREVDYSLKKLAATKRVCDELSQKLCEALGPTSQGCQIVLAQTPQFGPDKCKSMAAHMPDVIGELKEMQAANDPVKSEIK